VVPDKVVGLAGRGHQVLGESQQGFLGAVTPVRLVVLHAVYIQLIAALAEDPHAGEARDDVISTQLHLGRAVYLWVGDVILSQRRGSL
jgi:hypothetical protein